MIFDLQKVNLRYSKRARNAMGIVGKYCVVDSVLVMKLFNFVFGQTDQRAIADISLNLLFFKSDLDLSIIIYYL